MSRIGQTFTALKAHNKKALIPFITAGDPGKGWTVPLMHALVEAGADIIELGVPFSDPMADGPVIQRSSERAIGRGVGIRYILESAKYNPLSVYMMLPSCAQPANATAKHPIGKDMCSAASRCPSTRTGHSKSKERSQRAYRRNPGTGRKSSAQRWNTARSRIAAASRGTSGETV